MDQAASSRHRPSYRLVWVGTDGAAEALRLSPVVAEAVAVSVGAGESPPTVVVRRQLPYVLLGPEDRRLPDLPKGLAFLVRQGYPVYERIGGGSAVVLDETCLSFAIARPCRDLTLVQRNYVEMGEGVLRALRLLGLPAGFGRAVGSYCEGPYDVVVAGRKIAGLAQALRRGFALICGMILVRQDPQWATDLLTRFYRAAGAAPALDPRAVTSLTELLGREVDLAEVETALRAGFAEVFDLSEPQRVSLAEWRRAGELNQVRRRA